MCEANAYLKKGDTEELILEQVDEVQPFEKGILLRNIFGEQKILNAKIKSLALVNHKIILEEIPKA
ncbi:CooT family nickel-binding protein [Bacillota bacterium LX-D]|nr:CooT family nickel-binding protein [Bacillota bacterium LX-D]